MFRRYYLTIFLCLLFISGYSVSSFAQHTQSLQERRERLRQLVEERLQHRNGISLPPAQSFTQYKYKAGNYTFDLVHEDRTRKYYIHVPEGYSPDRPIPLIVNFHGGGGRAEGHSKMTGMNKAADKYGFIAVYPRGTRVDGNANRRYKRFWNPGLGPNGSIHDDNIIAKQNDVTFTGKVLDDVQAKFNIDQKRVYAAGFSNGAMMAHRVGCDLSDRIKAIAPIGGPFWHFPDDCKLQKPLPVIYFHGSADVCAPYNGGKSECEAGISHEGRNFISAQATIDIWLKKNYCEPEFEIDYNNGNTACRSYAHCEQETTQIMFCTIEEGGHTWPGGKPYTIPGTEIGNDISEINANDIMWEFFKNLAE